MLAPNFCNVDCDNGLAPTPPIGGGRAHEFPFEVIQPYIVSGYPASPEHGFKYIAHIDSTDLLAYPSSQNFVHTQIPLAIILPHLSKQSINGIGSLHQVQVKSRMSKSDLLSLFDSHSCMSCKPYFSVFLAVDSKLTRDKIRKFQLSHADVRVDDARISASNNNLNNNNAQLEVLSSPCHGASEPTSNDHQLESTLCGRNGACPSSVSPTASDVLTGSSDFPPKPAGPFLIRDISQKFCDDSAPQKLEEAGCAVCSQLTSVSQLTRLKAVKNQLRILEVSGVTRVERRKASDPIREFRGPVLDYECNRICDGCRKHIRKNQIPPRALARGLWVGKVPEELASLRFVEKLLIARVRVNSCFVRVASSGLRKMASHVIAFESPVPKVYRRLPPPVEDLDEVLAVLFTEPCKPSEKEFQRTPLLVRRNHVARALEWLKLNHVDYTDLEISYEELNRYPEDLPPVSVEYRHSESNKVEEGTSVFDKAIDDGVSEGDCPFLVHGLTGDQMQTKSVEALKGIALRHWNNRGGALSVSHSENPLSIYNNPNLYPQMFPWLFPYGLGGIGSTNLSDKLHKQLLLMYHDKRFQCDITFPFVAFSHEQLKSSTSAGFLLAEKSNFSDIASRLLNINQEVLANMSARMAGGEMVKPTTDEEAACFQLINDLDHINGKVSGSTTSKKYMRSEIWSLIAYMGAPLWYITLSPADNKHPLCLYFADNKECFDINLSRTEDERYRLIANNPVAGARFFDFMVKMFIKHILGVDADHRGLYGDTSAYYGVVEQQGRLSLHLHMLVWIRDGISPDEIQRKLLDPNSDFRKHLIQYLEAVHAGEFMNGTMEDVEANVEAASSHTDYRVPTETMPRSPPSACESNCDRCAKCCALKSWWEYFRITVDDLLLRSNVHKCSSNKNKDGSQNKARPFKGCLDNLWGRCKARFPRPTFNKTEVNEESGGINLKKREPWLNTFSYHDVVTYLFRCNTDVTSLRSGTAIKGVLLYVSNYITKVPLKTHVIFDTVRSIFQKNVEMVGGSDTRKEKSRKLMTKIVNSLSAKMEMGSPMISMYLLRNPDHYKSHKFSPFYWQSFIQECRRPWVHMDDQDEANLNGGKSEKVVIIKRNNEIISLSPVLDYVYRSEDISPMCLYEWVTRCECEKVPKKKRQPKHCTTLAPADGPDHWHSVDSDNGDNMPVDSEDDVQASKESKHSLLLFQDGHPLVREW
jgi:hypothetical protein